MPSTLSRHANAHSEYAANFCDQSTRRRSPDVSGSGPEGNIGLQWIEIAPEECANFRAGFVSLGKSLAEYESALDASLPGYRPFPRP